MTSACRRCGTVRSDYRLACPTCGHRPVDEGLLVAWLLSTEHLSLREVEAVGQRIAGGHVVRPSKKQLARARDSLGRSFASDPGLGAGQRVALLLCGLLLTPLPGLVIWAWSLSRAPRTAWQALALSVPGAVVGTGLGLWLMLN